MNECVKILENVKMMLDVEIRNIEKVDNDYLYNKDRDKFITHYYDICTIQEKMIPGSSGLQIEKEPTIKQVP